MDQSHTPHSSEKDGNRRLGYSVSFASRLCSLARASVGYLLRLPGWSDTFLLSAYYHSTSGEGLGTALGLFTHFTRALRNHAHGRGNVTKLSSAAAQADVRPFLPKSQQAHIDAVCLCNSGCHGSTWRSFQPIVPLNNAKPHFGPSTFVVQSTIAASRLAVARDLKPNQLSGHRHSIYVYGRGCITPPWVTLYCGTFVLNHPPY